MEEKQITTDLLSIIIGTSIKKSKIAYKRENAHRQKREQKAAHPRAMLSFKIAEFANFMI